MTSKLKRFYDRGYCDGDYPVAERAEDHPWYATLRELLERYGFAGKKCLEVGCGRGAFQDAVENYTGVDISEYAGKYMRKPFCSCSATSLPFADGSFEAIWSHAVLEHVPEPELALAEMRRVLCHGGLLLLAPAWQCRPWAAQGYAVRPYGELDWPGKLVKASIPIRDSVIFRSMYVFPRRLARGLACSVRRRPTRFCYRELEPNYERFWTSDSDAVNSMDPFDAILWFASRGDACLTQPTPLSKFFVRTGALVFRIRKRPSD